MATKAESFVAFTPTGMLEYVSSELYVELWSDVNRTYPEIRTLRKVIAVYQDIRQITVSDPALGTVRIPLERVAATYKREYDA